VHSKNLGNLIALKLKDTPKAISLKNHFGAPTVGSPYGPKTDNLAQYVQANPETFTPMKYAAGNKQITDAMKFRKDGLPGYENMLVPHVVKAGEFTNMAPAASTIINPEITGPKLHVSADITYPAVVKLPTFTGVSHSKHVVSAWNKQTGEIVHDNVIVNKPDMAYKTRVQDVTFNHQQLININTGKTITHKDPSILHGIDDTKKA
jgi:hypothetical protein